MRKLCLILVLTCVASMLPPAPRKRRKPITETTAGAGAAKLVAKVVVPQVVVPDYSRLLYWNWQESSGNYWTNTIFLIKRNSNLKDPVAAWETISWTPTNYWLFYINLDNPTMFFHVVASNTVTHLVSD